MPPRSSTNRLLRTVRSLRFRLTISYVLIFGVLLTGIGLYFRVNLERTFEDRIRELIGEDWNAARGLLRIQNGQATWNVDPKDVDQSFFLERLRRMLLLADRDGNVLEVSNGYRTVEVDSIQEVKEWFRKGGPQWKVKTDLRGDRVFLRYGVVRVGNAQYLLVMGRRHGDLQNIPALFLNNYFAALPVILLVTGLLGWFMAHRALAPVGELASAAERISGSTMDLRLPERDAGVEIDTLVHAFNRMMDRLKESFEQIRRFSTDVSHELRTPLTGIRGQLEVALFTAETADQFRDATVNALQDVDRLSNIVRALLLLSQAETGQLVLKQQHLRIGELVQEHVEEFAIPAEEAGLEITSQLDHGLAVEADRTQMDRLIANLLSNAVKYTPAGGKIHVVLQESDGGEMVELVVSDTGQGISPEDMPFIFDRFYKAPNADPEKGLGLGLSFVAWIVKVHKGTIHVESEPGKGTEFLVRLPKGRAEEPARKPAAAVEQESTK